MKLPEGWSAVLPPAVHAKCDYATYDMTYRLEDDMDGEIQFVSL
jgi:hypothetical protein